MGNVPISEVDIPREGRVLNLKGYGMVKVFRTGRSPKKGTLNTGLQIPWKWMKGRGGSFTMQDGAWRLSLS